MYASEELFERLKEFVDEDDDDDDDDDDDEEEEVDEGEIMPLFPFTVDKRLWASLNERFVDELVCNLLDEDDEEEDDDDVHDEDGDGEGDILTELVFIIFIEEEVSCLFFDDDGVLLDEPFDFDWFKRFSSLPPPK